MNLFSVGQDELDKVLVKVMKRNPGLRIVFVVTVAVVVVVWWRWTLGGQSGPGFVMTLEYTGQLVAGLRGLRSQQCWISSFRLPLVIVEPFLSNSSLRNSYDLWSQHSSSGSNNMRFHDIFDLNYFNEQSNASGQSPLVSWEHFHAFAPRKIIVVTLGSVHVHGCLSSTEETCTSDTVVANSLSPCNFPAQTERTILSLQRQNFVVVRSVCLSCLDDSTKITPAMFTKLIFGPYDARDVTVLINKWKFSFTLTKGCDKSCVDDRLWAQSCIESPRVKRDTTWYLQRYIRDEKFVAVMLRMEWYLISHSVGRENKDSASECLSQVLEAVEEYQSQIGGRSPFLTMDIGAYGSATFKGTLQRTNTSESVYSKTVSHAKNFVRDLYRGLWTFRDWEESFLTIPGVTGDKAYIGAVQRSIASRADCLVLMGGGHFQYMVLEEYLRLHPDKTKQCVKFVCMALPFRKMFTSKITS